MGLNGDANNDTAIGRERGKFPAVVIINSDPGYDGASVTMAMIHVGNTFNDFRRLIGRRQFGVSKL